SRREDVAEDRRNKKAGPKGAGEANPKNCLLLKSRSAEPSRPAGAGGLGQTPGRNALAPTDGANMSVQRGVRVFPIGQFKGAESTLCEPEDRMRRRGSEFRSPF